MKKYYPGEPVNIHIESLKILSGRTIGYLPPKEGKGKLPLFCGKGERLMTIYAMNGIIYQTPVNHVDVTFI